MLHKKFRVFATSDIGDATLNRQQTCALTKTSGVRKSTFFLVWLFVSVFASAQNPPGRFELEPTVEVVTPDHVYATTTESLRRLDFHNFQFRIFDEHLKSMLAARLRNGKYESKWTTEKGSNWLRLE